MKKRVEEELEKRKDEIELEVNRRVEAAKAQMEREMMIELEKRREAARLEEQKREVNIFNSGCSKLFLIRHHFRFLFGILPTGSNSIFIFIIFSIQEISQSSCLLLYFIKFMQFICIFHIHSICHPNISGVKISRFYNNYW